MSLSFTPAPGRNDSEMGGQRLYRQLETVRQSIRNEAAGVYDSKASPEKDPQIAQYEAKIEELKKLLQAREDEKDAAKKAAEGGRCAEGCCDSGPANHQNLNVAATADSSSTECSP